MKEYIVAIDLGDSNIVVAVGSPATGGRINIEHILSRPSEGVSAGQIMNIDMAVNTIKGALEYLRDTTGIEVHEVYIGLSGEFIYCTSHTDHVFVPDHRNGVTQQVVDALYERMSNVMVSEDRIIMERIPQRYVINDTTEVENPVGVFGSPLSSTFNFISSDNIPLGRIDMALRRLQITPRRIFSNAVVVGDAVLSPDEKEEGVVVVDIGGELTDIAIYHRNILRYISTIPMGAKSFNNDIRTLTIPKQYIEPLKLRYGCALSAKAPQELTVIIKGRSKNDQREIAVYNLAAVIEARARDIAELVTKEIADSSFGDKVPYGIVLTGGSAQLKHLDELFREVTGMEVRVAEAEDVISVQTRSKITSSSDSTVVGLLLHGLKYGPCDVTIGEPIIVTPDEIEDPEDDNGDKKEDIDDREKRERIERERIEREKQEKAEREERERIEREKQEQAEREERERIEREKQEQAEREERERIEREKREQAEREERERIEREKREQAEREKKKSEEQVSEKSKWFDYFTDRFNQLTNNINNHFDVSKDKYNEDDEI